MQAEQQRRCAPRWQLPPRAPGPREAPWEPSSSTAMGLNTPAAGPAGVTVWSVGYGCFSTTPDSNPHALTTPLSCSFVTAWGFKSVSGGGTRALSPHLELTGERTIPAALPGSLSLRPSEGKISTRDAQPHGAPRPWRRSVWRGLARPLGRPTGSRCREGQPTAGYAHRREHRKRQPRLRSRRCG